ncbi:WD repeat domain-containing protein 83 isoform X5 [Anthonomus grandis grandis]|uniref:WD repeat domain-containing protein 83 isoform X1 n=1 Tax=Anthonomus grandis grandis TaxID=2921223 RepID=UPI00216633EE|nr:WD repeat domain-containing protein 83 isoform X1 [Anthonomus grandis grandis]XP_050306589.1 WD repeat domain-containing protein 83 isoform X2 [Anthonomus grandis grandis]XP_050306590.1 WD repeat domain-containing protein 83 isoform X3 [Anthonomus grandis grandis]XP_050306591.1 WD repeat domain-containing protein 83 isoform X4 [Anthonomus grandis grandis]XP_050306592.1 WD repeat domain-containing protein 83 isoform X5 [Anthonomus grandis grandis]
MDLQCINSIDCNQGAVRAVRFNVDGSYCLTCGSDKKLKLWNPYRKLLLKTYGGHGNEVLDAAGSCDSSQIISCSSDKSIIVWDVSTGQPIRRLRGHISTVSCVKYNEESTVAISGGLDNFVMCWDLRSRSQVPFQTIKDAKDCISSIKVSDHEILTGSVDCCVRRYDIRNGRCDTDFVGSAITSVSFSNDGQCILVSSADNVVRLLDKNGGELLGEYKGHKINNLNIESDIITNDSYILSGSASGELWCWDLVSAEVKHKFLHTRNKALTSLSVHPTKDIILTASVGSLKLWSNPEDLPKDE